MIATVHDIVCGLVRLPPVFIWRGLSTLLVLRKFAVLTGGVFFKNIIFNKKCLPQAEILFVPQLVLPSEKRVDE